MLYFVSTLTFRCQKNQFLIVKNKFTLRHRILLYVEKTMKQCENKKDK